VAGAEQAGVEIPGGEVVVLPELIGATPLHEASTSRPPAIGTVALDRLVTGAELRRTVLELLRSGVPVHGLAHITGGGAAKLLRLNPEIGFEIDDPLTVPPILRLCAGTRCDVRRRDVGRLQYPGDPRAFGWSRAT
jgi:phosphoribosylformylglycinamidine cyclo-ligase